MRAIDADIPDARICPLVRRFRRSKAGLREVRKVARIVNDPTLQGTRIAWTPGTRFWRTYVRADLVPDSLVRCARAAQVAAVKARYAVGARIDGYVEMPGCGDFAITRSSVSGVTKKPPAWWKGEGRARWHFGEKGYDVWYDCAIIYPEVVYFEFRRVAEHVGDQLGLLAR